jgi:hypothetical protein
VNDPLADPLAWFLLSAKNRAIALGQLPCRDAGTVLVSGAGTNLVHAPRHGSCSRHGMELSAWFMARTIPRRLGIDKRGTSTSITVVTLSLLLSLVGHGMLLALDKARVVGCMGLRAGAALAIFHGTIALIHSLLMVRLPCITPTCSRPPRS